MREGLVGREDLRVSLTGKRLGDRLVVGFSGRAVPDVDEVVLTVAALGMASAEAACRFILRREGLRAAMIQKIYLIQMNEHGVKKLTMGRSVFLGGSSFVCSQHRPCGYLPNRKG